MKGKYIFVDDFTMMKASFRDKYISICEDTLQAPDRGVVKGVLLSHLKMDVCPVLETGKHIEQPNRSKKEKRRKKSNTVLVRKGCVHDSDKRSRSDKARSMDIYERQISGGKVELMTSDGYLIPEEARQHILQSRTESLSKSRSLPRERFVDRESSSLGTLIDVSYRDSKRSITVDQKGPVHEYIKVSRPPPYEEEEESPYSLASEFRKTDSLPKYFIIDDDGFCMHNLAVRDCWECESVNSDTKSSTPSIAENENERYKIMDNEWIPSEYLKSTLKKNDSFEYAP